MKKTTTLKALSIVSLAALVFQQANAATTTGNATQTVIAALAIANTSDLAFGSAPAGDAAKTVLPADATSGKFNVTGAPNVAYTITLPTNGTVTMTTGAGGANEVIAVNAFASTPATTGLLDGTGAQQLAVGATRAALGASQVAGAYTGIYSVTVVY